MTSPRDTDRDRARRLIRLLLRLDAHEVDEHMVDAIAREFAEMRIETVRAAQMAEFGAPLT